MNLPNTITAMRFFLMPIFVYVFNMDTEKRVLYATLVFLIAGISDVLDGYLARKMNIVTNFGIVMDPIADKLMLLTVLICFTVDKIIPIWIVVIVLSKEILMVIGGMMLYFGKDKKVIPANKYGKAATVSFYVAVFVNALLKNKTIGNIFMTAAILVMFLALFNYYLIYRKESMKK